MSAYLVTFSDNDVLHSDDKNKSHHKSESWVSSASKFGTSSKTNDQSSHSKNKKSQLHLSGFYAPQVKVSKLDDKSSLINSANSNCKTQSIGNSPYDCNRLVNPHKKSGKTLVSVFNYTPKKYVI